MTRRFNNMEVHFAWIHRAASFCHQHTHVTAFQIHFTDIQPRMVGLYPPTLTTLPQRWLSPLYALRTVVYPVLPAVHGQSRSAFIAHIRRHRQRLCEHENLDKLSLNYEWRLFS